MEILVLSCPLSGVFHYQISFLVHVAFALGQIIDAGWRHLPLSPSTNLSRSRKCLVFEITHGPFGPFPGVALPAWTVLWPCCGATPNGMTPACASCHESCACILVSPGANAAFHRILTLSRVLVRPLQPLLSQHDAVRWIGPFPMHSAVFQRQRVQDLPFGVIRLPQSVLHFNF